MFRGNQPKQFGVMTPITESRELDFSAIDRIYEDIQQTAQPQAPQAPQGSQQPTQQPQQQPQQGNAPQGSQQPTQTTPGQTMIPQEDVKVFSQNILAMLPNFEKDPTAQKAHAAFMNFMKASSTQNLAEFIKEFAAYTATAQANQQPQQPNAAPQPVQNGQQPAQQTQGAPQQPTVQNSSASTPKPNKGNNVSERSFFTSRDARMLNEEEEKNLDPKGNEKVDTNTPGKKPSESDTKDTKDIHYDTAYNKDDSNVNKGGETDGQKVAKQNEKPGDHTIKDNPFLEDNAIKYDNMYDSQYDSATPRDNGVEVTSVNPFKPADLGNIGFRNLSNPSNTAERSVPKKQDTNNGSPAKTNTAPKGSNSHQEEDDGSDDGESVGSVKESFNHSNPFLLNESVSDNVIRTIVQQYIDEGNDAFDIDGLHRWVKKNYPKALSNAGIFDKFVSETERLMGGIDSDISEENQEDDDLEPQNEFDSDEVDDIAKEYTDNCTEEETHDIFKLVTWLYDNHPEVLDDDELTERIYKKVSGDESDEDVTIDD